MRALPALVILPSARDSPGHWQPLAKRLRHHYQVRTPPLPGLAAGSAEPFSLERAASELAATLPRTAGGLTTVCGIGLGAMVALQLAATEPDRLARLVLLTRQVTLSPVIMSLSAAALPLVPASAIQRLGAGQDQVLALLDQVRPVDATAVARRVPTRALVLCGDHDRGNRRASQALARALPHGDLRLVAQAGTGWLSPQSLADALLHET